MTDEVVKLGVSSLDEERLRVSGEDLWTSGRCGWTDACPSERRQSGDWLAGRASNLGERNVHFGVVDNDQHIDVRSLSYGRKGDALQMAPLWSVHLPVHCLLVAGDTISGCGVKLAAERSIAAFQQYVDWHSSKCACLSVERSDSHRL